MSDYVFTGKADMSEHDEALKKSADQIKNYTKNIDAANAMSGKFSKSIRAQIAETKNLLITLENTGRANTREYREAQKALAGLVDQMGDMSQAARMMASDTVNFDIAKNSINGLVSAMSALQAVTVLSESENKRFAKVMKGLQTSIALVTAATQLANLAQKQFIATMKANPWGLAIAGATALIGILTTLNKKEKEINAVGKERAKIIEDTAKASANAVVKVNLLANSWSKLQSSEKVDWLKQNKKALDDLGISLKNVNDAEEFFAGQGLKSYIKSVQLRAEAAAIQAQLEEVYTKQLKERKISEQILETFNKRTLHYGEESEKVIKDLSKAYNVTERAIKNIVWNDSSLNSFVNEEKDLLKSLEGLWEKQAKYEKDLKGFTPSSSSTTSKTKTATFEELRAALNEQRRVDRMSLEEQRDYYKQMFEDTKKSANERIDAYKKYLDTVKKIRDNSGSIPRMSVFEVSSSDSTLSPINVNSDQFISNTNDKMQELIESTNEEVSAAARLYSTLQNIDAMSLESLGSSLSKAAYSLKSIGNTELGNIIDVAGTISQAIATMILSYTKAAAESSSMGPIAWAAFAASGLAEVLGVISALKSASKFATGGIVNGNTSVGDQVLVRANRGEMILNNREQSRLWNIMNGNLNWHQGTDLSQNVTFHISGSDLVGTLQNYNNKIKRVN